MNNGAVFRRMNRTIGLFLLSLFLSFSCARAEPFESLLTGTFEEPFSLEISAPAFRKLKQFDEDRTASLNQLLQHLSFRFSLDGLLSETVFSVDDEPVYTVTRMEEEAGFREIYSFAPDTVYRTDGAQQTAEEPFPAFLQAHFFQLNQAMDELYEFAGRLPTLFSDYVKEEKANVQYKAYGKAVKRLTITLPKDFVRDSLPQALLSAADGESLRTFFSGLSFSGSQKIILLCNENDRPVRISYNGHAGWDPDALRNISAVWKCGRDGQNRRDSLTLKTPAVSGYDKDNYQYDRERTIDPETNEQQLTWKLELDHKAGTGREKIQFTGEFQLTETEGNGKAEYRNRHDSKDERLTLTSVFQTLNGKDCDGTLEISEYLGKIEQNSLSVHLRLGSRDSLNWPEETAQPVPSDSDKIQEELTRLIIRKILQLPSEDLSFIARDLPEDFLESIRELIP